MPPIDGDLLRVLMAEIDRWRHAGLIDAPTRKRLRAHYLDEPAARPAAAAVAVASVALRADVELAREVAEHARLEAEIATRRAQAQAQRARALEVPVAHRAVDAGGVATAARAIGAATAQVNAEQPSAEQALVERQTRWPGLLARFVGQNVFWLLGGLMVVFGSIYWLQVAWQRLSQLWLYTIIAAGAHGYAAAFFGAGYGLARKREAHSVARVLFCMSAALLPLAGAASALLVAQLVGGGARGVALALLVSVLTLGAQGAIYAVIGGLFERRALLPTLMATLPALALLLAAPALGAASPWLLFGALAALHLALRRAAAARVTWREALWLVGGAGVWSTAVLVGCVVASSAAAASLSFHAAWIALLAAVLLDGDRRLRRAAGAEPRLSALGALLHGVALLALTLAFVGLARAGLRDTAARVAVLVAAGLATLGFARGALLHGRGLLTYAAASCGMVAFYFAPAPLSPVVRFVRERLGPLLGYSSTPLPPAFYAVALVPYVALLGVIAFRLAGQGDVGPTSPCSA